jgi:hypothetical protein
LKSSTIKGIFDRLLPILDEMITGGALVTMERVRVLKYAAGQKHTNDLKTRR